MPQQLNKKKKQKNLALRATQLEEEREEACGGKKIRSKGDSPISGKSKGRARGGGD